jgi:hypothetical protein
MKMPNQINVYGKEVENRIRQALMFAEENGRIINERKNRINKSLNSFMNTNRFDGKCLNLEGIKSILNQNLEQLTKELKQKYLGEKNESNLS